MFDRTRDPEYQRKLAEARAADVRRTMEREQQAEALEHPGVGRRRWLPRLLLLILVVALVYVYVMSAGEGAGAS